MRALPQEEARLEALAAYRVLDTPPEPEFDDITALCARFFEVPIALVTLVDADRQWFKSRVGLDLTETRRSISFCTHAIREPRALVVDDATQDHRFRDNPLVTGAPGIRFYAGVPVRSADGHALGTLCVIDTAPRRVTDEQLDVLTRLARQVEVSLELRRRNLELDDQLSLSRASQQRRVELAAMVVHDLRNPVTAIALLASTAEGLTEDELRADVADIGRLARATQGMLADVLDICISEVDGVPVRAITRPAGDYLDDGERTFRNRARAEGVALVCVGERELPVHGDPGLVSRALANLIDNAMRHSAPGSTIRLSVAAAPRAVRLAVEDEAGGIPESERERLFETFAQGGETPGRRGLGLAFCRVVAEAHRGRVWAEANDPSGSRFVLELPAADPERPPEPA